MRCVRAAKWSGETVLPKSRLIIPRHMDPQIGTYRTDALNNSWPAMEVAVTIALSLHMPAETFDVCATRLSGMSIDRSMDIRAPTW